MKGKRRSAATGLIRPILAVVTGILVSVLLASLSGWHQLQRNDTRAAIQTLGDSIEGKPVDDGRAQSAMEAMEQDLRRMTWVYAPLIAAFTGMVVGLVTRRGAAALAALAAAPFSIMFSLPGPGFSSGIGHLLVYLAVAALGGWGVSRLAGLLKGSAAAAG